MYVDRRTQLQQDIIKYTVNPWHVFRLYNFGLLILNIRLYLNIGADELNAYEFLQHVKAAVCFITAKLKLAAGEEPHANRQEGTMAALFKARRGG